MFIFFNILNSIFYQIEAFTKSDWFLALKVFSILLSLGLFIVIIVLLFKANIVKMQIIKYKAFLEGTKYEKRRTIRIWKKIIKLLKERDETKRKEAIILADKLLAEILERGGWVGKDLDEILSKISVVQLPHLEKINFAHQIAKKIAEDPNLPIGHNEAIKILMIYEQTFRDFDLLD